MYLFIDTNIFLSFYHFTSDDLEELRKLAVLSKQGGQIQLLLTQQVDSEFRRNRENKIADALKKLKEQKLNLQFPQLCKEYDEYSQLKELQRLYEIAHSKLLEKLTVDVVNKALKADAILTELFGLASKVTSTPLIVERARLRSEIGNPPGKQGSLGDAINWESLLDVIPLGQDLCFVTDDRDFCSPLDENRFDAFLLHEWAKNKNSKLFFYNRLSGFFKERFPYIKLASEYEKDNLIRELAISRSFNNTHIVIAQLQKYTDFTLAQADEILATSVSNGQIYRIIKDEDVKDFITNVIANKESGLDQTNIKKLRELLNPTIDSGLPTSMPLPPDEEWFNSQD